MSDHPFRYSMVVDDQPLHLYQAENLLFTLQEFAGVPPERIVLQCTERVTEQVRAEFTSGGHAVTVISPYLDGKYCNKVVQLDHFLREDVDPASGVFLLDLDFVVLAPFDPAERQCVWGKVVDGENPPLPVLMRIFSEAGVELPGIVPCDWGTGDTVATNLNGGLLYVPFRYAARVQGAWRTWAEFLDARPELFDGPGQRDHMDQIAFALALAAERIPYRHLSANWNFPAHSTNRPESFEPEATVRGLHYHRCLDAFGLIEPAFADGGSGIGPAVQRANAAIGGREESLGFDLYKRHLAGEAVKQMQSGEPLPFSEAFISRTRIGDRKRRLILHAGTPKTGTTSLQWHLASNARNLAERGFWYPAPSEKADVPKHQELVGLLRRGDAVAFTDYMEKALHDMPGDAHTIIFTTEGIFNHWWDYTPSARNLLRQFAALFDYEVCVWFREPESFAAALYVQCIKNGRTTDVMGNVYGQDISCTDALQDEWFRRHLDYLGFYHEIRELFGAEHVRVFLYDADTIRTFEACYGLGFLPEPSRRRRNATAGALAVRLLRALNRIRVKGAVRLWCIALVERMDRMVGAWTGKYRLIEQERILVRQCAARGWNAIRRQLS